MASARSEASDWQQEAQKQSSNLAALQGELATAQQSLERAVADAEGLVTQRDQLIRERDQAIVEAQDRDSGGSRRAVEEALDELDRVRGDLFLQNTEVLNLTLDLQEARARLETVESALAEARAQPGNVEFGSQEAQQVAELVSAYRSRRDADRNRWSEVEVALGKAVQEAVGAKDEYPEQRELFERLLNPLRALLDRGRIESERHRRLEDEEEILGPKSF